MGSHYLADEPETGRRGLLHVLVPPKAGREAERARLKRELLKQATLTVDGVATPFASGESNGTSWLFRPQVPGESLALAFKLGRALSPRDALSASAQVTAALDGLHRGGLLHRDLTPANIIMEEGCSPPRPVLVGVGIAPPLVRQGGYAASGTPGYVAPEQISGKLVSFRSDLYSLGCVIYEMLGGRPAFMGESPDEILERQLGGTRPPPLTGFPAAICDLLESLLSPDPQKRPFSAKKVRRTLDTYLPGSALMTPRSSSTSASSKAASNGEKPSVSVPPPPPAEALRRSTRPRASESVPPTPRRAPTSSESTQQLDIRQIEEIRVTEQAPRSKVPPLPGPDQTQELSIDQLLSVSRAAPAPESPKKRSDETVPIRLDQIMSVASTRRNSTKPPTPPAAAAKAPAEVALTESDPAPDARPDEAIAEATGDATIVVDASVTMADAPPQSEAESASDPQTSELPAPAATLGSPPSSLSREASAGRQSGAGVILGATAREEPPAPLFDLPTTAPVDSNAVASTAGSPAVASPDDSAAATTVLSQSEAQVATERPARVTSASPSDGLEVPGLSGVDGWFRRGTGRRRMAIGAAVLLLGVVGVRAFWGDDEEAKAGATDPRPDTGALLTAGDTTRNAPIPTAAAPAPLPNPPAAAHALPGTETAEEAEPATLGQEAEPADAALMEPEAEEEAAPNADEDEANEALEEAGDETPDEASDEEAQAEPAVGASGRAPSHKRARRSAHKAKRRARQAAAKKPAASSQSSAKAEWTKALAEARGHYAAKRYRQAARSYEHAIRFVPNDAGTFSGLGAARLMAGNTKGAIAAYRRAVSLAPGRAGFHAALGRAYLAAGNKRSARTAYKKALSLDPNNKAAKNGLKALAR